MKTLCSCLIFLSLISLTSVAWGDENQRVVRWFVNNATGEVYKPPFYAGDNYFIERGTGREYHGLAYCLKMVELGRFTVIIPDTPTPTGTPTPPPPTATPHPTPKYRASARYYEGENGKTRLRIKAAGKWKHFSLPVYASNHFLGMLNQYGANLWQGDLELPGDVELRTDRIWVKDSAGNSANVNLLGRYFENTQAVYTPSDQYWDNYEKNRAVIESDEKFVASPTPVKYRICATCSGSGRISKIVKTTYGEMKKTIECPDCNGKGKVKVP